jgi:hypothetical protein
VAVRWICLILIGVILTAGGYLIFERYFYGPLNITDLSGRVITMDEKEQLDEQLHQDFKYEAPTKRPTSYELTRIVRSGMDPLTVCGMGRFQQKSGAWGNWQLFLIEFPGDHPVTKETVKHPLLREIVPDTYNMVYRTPEGVRAITPRDTFICEPNPTRCPPGQCALYDWTQAARLVDEVN